MEQILFDREGLETFYSYIENRLSKVPLDQLLIEPIREPTPSASKDGDFKEKSKTNSGKGSEKSLENKKSRNRESIQDTTQSAAKTDEQTSTIKHTKTHTPYIHLIKPRVINLEEEWDNFNKKLNIEEQAPETQMTY